MQEDTGVEENTSERALDFRSKGPERARRREKHTFFFPLLSCVPAPRSSPADVWGHGDSRGLKAHKTPREGQSSPAGGERWEEGTDFPRAFSPASRGAPPCRQSCRKYGKEALGLGREDWRGASQGAGGKDEGLGREVCREATPQSWLSAPGLTLASQVWIWPLLTSQTGHCGAQGWTALKRLWNLSWHWKLNPQQVGWNLQHDTFYKLPAEPKRPKFSTGFK